MENIREIPKKQIANIKKKASKTRREYLWVMVIVLAVGHLLWIAWLLFSEFYLLPQATISRNEEAILQKEVELKNKYAPSYSFYDNYGNLSGILDLSDMDLKLSALVVEGVDDSIDIEIYVRRDEVGSKEERLYLIKKYDTEDLDKVSWSDLVAVARQGNEHRLLVLDRVEGEYVFVVFDNELDETARIPVEDYQRVRSFVSSPDTYKLYFVGQALPLTGGGDGISFSRYLVELDLSTKSTRVVWSESTTEESDSFVTDIRLLGVFGGKYVVVEKVFHLAGTFHNNFTAVNIDTGKGEVFDSRTHIGDLAQ